MAEIPDRRGRKGRPYPLRAVLGLALAAMVAGADDLMAIFRRARRLPPEPLRQFGPTQAPCHASFAPERVEASGDARAAAICDGPPPDLAVARAIDKGHGRIETRELAASSELVGDLHWPGVAQVGRIERIGKVAPNQATSSAVRRRQDDHGSARSAHPAPRHRRDRQRGLAVQASRLISPGRCAAGVS